MERSEELRRRARHSYERGRVRLAASHATLALIPLGLALWTWPERRGLLLWFVALYAVLALFQWRGGPAGRGAGAGLIAGSMPLVAMVLASTTGHVCIGGVCRSPCVPICVASGLLAGAFVVWRGTRSPSSLMFWGAAGVVGSLTAAMACVPLGLGATLGMAAGVAIIAVPGAALASRAG